MKALITLAAILAAAPALADPPGPQRNPLRPYITIEPAVAVMICIEPMPDHPKMSDVEARAQHGPFKDVVHSCC